MAKTSKFSKFEIESSSGTLTDITSYVKSIQWEDYKPPSFWRQPITWFMDWLRRRKMRKVKTITGSMNVVIHIEGPYIEDPWKWN